MEKTRIVFMGSPDFATDALRNLAENFDVVGVVTQPDKPAGRGKKMQSPPVKILADELGIPVYQPTKLRTDEQIEPIKQWKPDVIVVAAFGQILRPNLLELPKFGCINIHASLLPRWRGAAPINAAILHGDKTTGITIMQMDEGLGTGDMLAKAEIEIGPSETAGELFDRLKTLGANLIVETLPKIISGEIQPEKQDDAVSTYAPMLNKADGELDFSKSAEELERQVRAYHPWPGSYFFLNELMIKVHASHVIKGKNDTAGNRTVIKDTPAIFTKDGVLVLDMLQPAGKKPMKGADFLRGAQNWEN